MFDLDDILDVNIKIFLGCPCVLMFNSPHICCGKANQDLVRMGFDGDFITMTLNNFVLLKLYNNCLKITVSVDFNVVSTFLYSLVMSKFLDTEDNLHLFVLTGEKL